MSKVYLVTYNTDSNFNKDTFHKYLTSLFPNFISDWWHYIDNVYIIVSELPVNNLYNLIFPGVPKRFLLITEIKPGNEQGWLPKGAWEWLQKYRQST